LPGKFSKIADRYAYARNNLKTSIKFRTEMPDYLRFKAEDYNSGYFHQPGVEELPRDAPNLL